MQENLVISVTCPGTFKNEKVREMGIVMIVPKFKCADAMKISPEKMAKMVNFRFY